MKSEYRKKLILINIYNKLITKCKTFRPFLIKDLFQNVAIILNRCFNMKIRLIIFILY